MKLDSIGGRKFAISILAVLCTAVLMWFGKISDGVYSTIMIAALGVYVAGNVTQKNNETKPAEIPPA